MKLGWANQSEPPPLLCSPAPWSPSLYVCAGWLSLHSHPVVRPSATVVISVRLVLHGTMFGVAHLVRALGLIGVGVLLNLLLAASLVHGSSHLRE